MANKVLVLGIIAIAISSLVVGGALVLLSSDTNDSISDDQVIVSDKFLYYYGVNISWLGEAAFRITSGNRVVYIDPYLVANDAEIADIIISTHQHGEHLSLTDIFSLGDTNAALYTPKPDPSIDGTGPSPEVLLQLLLGNVTFTTPGMVVHHDSGIILEFVPAYNIDKFSPFTGQLWHPPWANWTGVIVEIGGTRIYHAGDSGHIPEMEQIDCDIFLAPIGGVATMTSHEAAEAVESLKITSNLKYAIPMHYPYFPEVSSQYMPSGVFSAHANCPVAILQPLGEN
ncbi:MAG: MBL fold metallo-hydrolase [Candidatus Heimdallarchaeota archaeon]